MTDELWSYEELIKAASGMSEGHPQNKITGFSIDTRSLQSGDIFLALQDQRDGHEFVSTAFAKGASVAIVSEGYSRKDKDGPFIRVKDTLASLESIGRAGRGRLSSKARVIAVTGSVGKTTTKEMLRFAFTSIGKTHASTKSYNNLWGVPLSLARMPSDTQYAIFEIGMNHAGEITPLTKMVQPHVAIVTTVEAVHLENFRSVSEIAEAKAEIFKGLVENGSAIINLDNPHWARLYRSAKEYKAQIIGVTKEMMATEAVRSFAVERAISLKSIQIESGNSKIKVEQSSPKGEVLFVLGAPGDHIVTNALYVAAALNEVGGDVERGMRALEFFTPPQGRGTRTYLKLDGGSFLLIDESYNANPASMRAALSVLSTISRQDYPRRIAVLGDMLELGPQSAKFHEDLWEAVDEAGVDLVFASGPNMIHLMQRIPQNRKGGWAQSSKDLQENLLSVLKAGDVVMIKGSNNSQMGLLTETILKKFAKSS